MKVKTYFTKISKEDHPLMITIIIIGKAKYVKEIQSVVEKHYEDLNWKQK